MTTTILDVDTELPGLIKVHVNIPFFFLDIETFVSLNSADKQSH